ncbi:hypothetical protein [Actinoplanes sp. NPDC089786]|uniref:hypothetical protein n=1 Tax=Actinoplanes sp. NPDC089786 TaxID=3155185 RepID=UPI00341D045B
MRVSVFAVRPEWTAVRQAKKAMTAAKIAMVALAIEPMALTVSASMSAHDSAGTQTDESRRG